MVLASILSDEKIGNPNAIYSILETNGLPFNELAPINVEFKSSYLLKKGDKRTLILCSQKRDQFRQNQIVCNDEVLINEDI